MIDKETEQRIKDAANIVDVVGEFVELRKRGANYEGICPFHSDRTPGSFQVNEGKNICTCFSCGTGALDPIAFLRKKEGLTYAQALRWLAGRYGIACAGADEYEGIVYEKRVPAPPKEVLDIPAKWATPTLQRVGENTLVKWLKSLPWDAEQQARIDTVLKLYCVGHYGKEGHTMFWQIDEDCKIRTGKMMLYKPDGHRDKDSQHNFDWIHAWLGRNKFYDTDKYDYSTCYFGSHLVDSFKEATINLVESEKTALIMAIAYGNLDDHLWLATGGKSNFNRYKMEPLIKRRRSVIVYPDLDGMAEWEALAKTIDYERLSVNRQFLERHWKPDDGPKADIADVIVRMICQPDIATIEAVKKKYPALIPLIEELELEIRR